MKKIIIAVICSLIVVIGGILIFNSINRNVITNEQQIEETNPSSENENISVSDEKATNEENIEKNNKTEANSENKNTEEPKKEEKVYTPTFMFFVSNSDEGFDSTNKTVDELKKAYDGKVTFDIVNIDEKPEAKDNFPVDGNTPFLIMLNTKNDISAFQPMCKDKKQMVDIIEAALNS